MDKLNQYFQRRKRKGAGPPPLPTGINTALTPSSYSATPTLAGAPTTPTPTPTASAPPTRPESPPPTNGTAETGSDSESTELEFPDLTPQEEQEIFTGLGIESKGKSVKEVIVGTLRSFKQVKVLSDAAAKASAPVADEQLEDFGTVRIKTDEGTKFGTLRGRKGAKELFLEELKDAAESEEDFGTVRIKPLATSNSSIGEDSSDAFSTLRINDLSSSDGSASNETPPWMGGGQAQEDSVRYFQ